MINENRPKPASFGFDADFADLSKVKPVTRAINPNRAVKPQPDNATPKSQSVKKAKPKTKPIKKSEALPVKTSREKPEVLKQREVMADQLAKSMGFESREQKTVVLKKRRRTHHDEPVDQLSIRGPVRVLNDFITFCETENLSYWEAMERLLKT